MEIHLLFDLFAYALGTFLSWKVFRPQQHFISNENLRYIYYSIVLMGAVFGAISLGSLNIHYSIESQNILLGKSILGAIVGATITVEVFKKIMKIKGSTGAYFVPSLAIGIAVGRVGCFLSGLEDYTYGAETNFILGYDFGDGLLRHPVQLYEAFTMALFFLYVVYIYFKNRNYFENYIFYQFILVYATQRFMWEFLKPYETIFFGLNVFQLFCIGLIIYAIFYLKKGFDEKL
jgi:prolipoprotein diacylglyceryltransferase